MNYAGTYHIGNDTYPQGTEAKTVAPTVMRVCKLDETNERRKRNQKRQTSISADYHASNGFLRTTFLPKLKETGTIQDCKGIASWERDFYQSLSQLAENYNIVTMETKSFPYPYNIALALWNTEEQLKKSIKNWEEIKLIQDSKKTFLTSEERYNTGSTLYYIPIIPLYRMLKNPKRKYTAQLLLSVCSYLYHIANVPYYKQENSFLYWQYEILKEWVLSDDETEETIKCLKEIEQADWIGEQMEQKIYNHANLAVFKKRLESFICKDKLDKDSLKVAQEAFSIYTQYENQNVFSNARPNGEAEDDDLEHIVTMDRYISFCADGTGWLSDNLVETVNTELQEYTQLEEPIIIKRFNGEDITGNSLDFENRLFNLMEELISILNNF